MQISEELHRVYLHSSKADMVDHFTKIVNSETRWSELCSLLDSNNYWRVFAGYIKIEPAEILTQNDNMFLSPSRTLLNRWVFDHEATVSNLLQILKSMNHKEAVSLVESWIVENTFASNSNANDAKSNSNDDPFVFLSSLSIGTPGEDEYQQGHTMYWMKPKEALPLLLKAADQGYPPAYLMLKRMYGKPAGTSRDLQKRDLYLQKMKESKEWFEQQSKTGNPMAQYHMGLFCEMVGDKDEACNWYIKASYGDVPAAQLQLAIMQTNRGMYTEALYWLHRASDLGFAAATDNIGRFYYNQDTSVKQDYNKALQYFLSASSMGHVSSCVLVGRCYENGQGVEKDERLAFEWYLKGAQDIAEAQHRVGRCYFGGIGVSEDPVKAVYWWKKAAEENFAAAEYSLGQCYLHGVGVQQDYQQSLDWLLRAAQWSFKSAQVALGDCYYEGTGVQQQYETAVAWYQLAAKGGLAEAQARLGDCFFHGHGVKQDYTEAMHWYEMAYDNGEEYVIPNLQICYEETKTHKKALHIVKKTVGFGLNVGKQTFGKIKGQLNDVKAKIAKQDDENSNNN